MSHVPFTDSWSLLTTLTAQWLGTTTAATTTPCIIDNRSTSQPDSSTLDSRLTWPQSVPVYLHLVVLYWYIVVFTVSIRGRAWEWGMQTEFQAGSLKGRYNDTDVSNLQTIISKLIRNVILECCMVLTKTQQHIATDRIKRRNEPPRLATKIFPLNSWVLKGKLISVESNEKEGVFLLLSTLTRRTSDGNDQFCVLAVLLFQERPPHEAKRDEKKNVLPLLRNETWPAKSCKIKTTLQQTHDILISLSLMYLHSNRLLHPRAHYI